MCNGISPVEAKVQAPDQPPVLHRGFGRGGDRVALCGYKAKKSWPYIGITTCEECNRIAKELGLS